MMKTNAKQPVSGIKRLIISIVLITLAGFYMKCTAQEGKVHGHVLETGSKLPLIGVAIQVHGLEKGTLTNVDGEYELILPAGKYLLNYSFIGYEAFSDSVTILPGTFIEKTVSLDASVEELEEVVVTGYASGIVSSVSDIRIRGVGSIRSSKKGKYSTSAPSVAYEMSDAPGGKRGHVDNDANAGLLTAGELHDFSKWELWQDITEDQLSEWQKAWQMKPVKRYSVQLVNNQDNAVVDALVLLKSTDGKTLWTARTDNTGKAELWANMFEKEVDEDEQLWIETWYEGKSYQVKNASEFHDGMNVIDVNASCKAISAVDVAFVVDATGSMGDEIQYLKAELNDVITKVKNKHSEIDLNLGSVFYRDNGDEYVTRVSPLDSAIDNTISFIKNQFAAGGGDYPEAVEEGLGEALNKLNWRTEARARLLFLVLDAPPHNDQERVAKMQAYARQAAEQGVRVIPVTASGLDKSTEYLMRCLALASNGTYVFLTDDSGIGNPHIKPTTDEYEVELLNDLLIRLFDQFATLNTCSNEELLSQEVQDTSVVVKNIKTQDSTNDSTEILQADSSVLASTDSLHLKNNLDSTTTNVNPAIEEINWKYYPNPTSGRITIEIEQPMEEMFLCDITGKILERYDCHEKFRLEADISRFPNGMYLLRGLYDKDTDQWLSGKVILIH